MQASDLARWGKGELKDSVGKRLLNDKYNAIRSYVQRPKNWGEDFVTVVSLREVWKGKALREFIEGVGLGFEPNDKQLGFIEDNLLRTFSILVYMRWEREEWQNFLEIFMKDGAFRDDRRDSELPYELEDIEHETFLGSWGLPFYNNQYTFIPIVLEQGKVIIYEKGRRLPLKTGGEMLGIGAYATVTKEVIPEGHLVRNGRGEAVTFPKLYQDISLC